MSTNQELIQDLIVEAGLIDNDVVADLLVRASAALMVSEGETARVLLAEQHALEALAKEGFDQAHGREFKDWEPLAKDAMRIRIAAEVLSQRIQGTL